MIAANRKWKKCLTRVSHSYAFSSNDEVTRTNSKYLLRILTQPYRTRLCGPAKSFVFFLGNKTPVVGCNSCSAVELEPPTTTLHSPLVLLSLPCISSSELFVSYSRLSETSGFWTRTMTKFQGWGKKYRGYFRTSNLVLSVSIYVCPWVQYLYL